MGRFDLIRVVSLYEATAASTLGRMLKLFSQFRRKIYSVFILSTSVIAYCKEKKVNINVKAM